MLIEVLKTSLLSLLVSLLIGCSAQTRSFWKAVRGENERVELPPVGKGPEPLRPVIYGMHEVNGGEAPRLKTRIGASAAPGVKLTFNRMAGFHPEDERFKVYVPKGYTDDVPHGLLVHLGNPWIPGSWLPVFDEKQIIWIWPSNADNSKEPSHRIQLALEARKHGLLNYNIDPKRIYISGISGGGVVCSALLALYPDAFNGSLHIVGVSGFQRSDRAIDQLVRNAPRVSTRQGDRSGFILSNGRWVAPNISTRHNRVMVSDRVIRKLRQNNRFVLITGPGDSYYRGVKDAYRSMRELGMEALLIDLPDLGHHFPRGREPVVQSLDYLDRKL